MTTTKEVLSALLSKGYQKIPLPALASSGEVWLRHESSTEDVEHFMRLEYKPASKAYSVHVGVVNPEGRNLVRNALPEIIAFMRPPLALMDKFFIRECWHLFDAGRALKWKSVFVVPDPKDRDGWSELIDQLFVNFLQPNFFTIVDAKGVCELLLRKEAPFEWFSTPSVMRAAEIIALGFVSGFEKNEIRMQASKCRENVERDLAAGKTFDEFVDVCMISFEDSLKGGNQIRTQL